jgi:Flp pilus assembly pilin Flp
MLPISAASEVQAAAWRPRLTNFAEVFCVSKLKLFTNESGQTMAEYGVVLTVITIACLGALSLLAGNVIGAIARVAGIIP